MFVIVLFIATVAANGVTSCSFGQFRCTSGQCIDIDKWCDGSNDCIDKTDEGSDFCFWQSKDHAHCGRPQIEPTGAQIPAAGSTTTTITKRRAKRTVNGEQAKEGSWPWLIAMGNCGGSIIGRRWILSAAHCLDTEKRERNGKYGFVTVGEYNVNVESPNKFEVEVENIFLHPWYSPEADHDVALMELTKDLPLAENKPEVAAVCLARPLRQLYPITEGKPCIVAGWGDQKYNATAKTAILQQVMLPILPDEVCLDYYDPDSGNSVLCAGYTDGRADTCQGDSGSPLVCRWNKDPSVWIQEGVVSAGDNCAYAGTYGRVSSSNVYSWIVNTIALGRPFNSSKEIYYDFEGTRLIHQKDGPTMADYGGN